MTEGRANWHAWQVLPVCLSGFADKLPVLSPLAL